MVTKRLSKYLKKNLKEIKLRTRLKFEKKIKEQKINTAQRKIKKCIKCVRE